MSLERVSVDVARLDRGHTAKVLFEHFRFRRVWCPLRGRDCDAVVRVVNGMEVGVRQCHLRDQTADATCPEECVG